jgi:hypothetical protein
MKSGPPRLSRWTFSRWHKFLLPIDLNDAFLVIAYLTDKPKAQYGLVAHGSLAAVAPTAITRLRHRVAGLPSSLKLRRDKTAGQERLMIEG